jgi:hypothetical protein
LPRDAAMIPFPKEEVTPPVIKMYFVCEAIRRGGGVEISWILMGYKGRKFSWIAFKKGIGIFEEKNKHDGCKGLTFDSKKIGGYFEQAFTVSKK